MTDQPIVPSPESGLPRGLSQPALRALYAANCATLDDVSRLSERELSALHGVGPRAVRLLREALAARGQGFAAPKAGER